MIPLRRHTQEENVDSWLMSYADMITLLLAFFIIFVSTSEPKQEKLAAATKGMQERFGSLMLESPFEAVYRDLTGIISSTFSDGFIATEKTSHGLKMELSAREFFREGTAEMPPARRALVAGIAEALKRGELAQYRISVEGHTSDATVIGPGYGGAWELASARAIHVLHILVKGGVKASRLHAASFADTQPILANLDAAGKPIFANQARNERIVIRMEKDDGR